MFKFRLNDIPIFSVRHVSNNIILYEENIKKGKIIKKKIVSKPCVLKFIDVITSINIYIFIVRYINLSALASIQLNITIQSILV